MDYEARFNKGMKYLKDKKYIKAEDEFNYVVLTGSHTEWGDDALFYLGEAYYGNEEYLLAISEYDQLTRRMTFSPFVEKARWRMCQSYFKLSPKYYLDQGNTQKAIEKTQEFLDDYPESDYVDAANDIMIKLRNKLGEKSYQTGILYIKLGIYDSAVDAFENVLKSYYDTDYISESYLGLITAYCHLQNLDKAKELYSEYESDLKDAKLLAKADAEIHKCEKRIEKKSDK